MNIVQKSIKGMTLFTVMLMTAFTHASGGDGEENHGSEAHGNQIDTAEEIRGYIKHHLQDSHDFVLYTDGETGKHYGFSLPVIVSTSKGIKFFMSSEFHHNDDGHVIVEKDGVKLAKIHSKIYELNDGAATVEFDSDHHATNAHKVIDLSITKSVVGMLLTALLMFLGFSSLARGYKKGAIPTGFARVLEPLVIYVRDEIARPNIGEKKIPKIHEFFADCVLLHMDFELARFDTPWFQRNRTNSSDRLFGAFYHVYLYV
jgi:F-type H+-transporting ATPase subunit a